MQACVLPGLLQGSLHAALVQDWGNGTEHLVSFFRMWLGLWHMTELFRVVLRLSFPDLQGWIVEDLGGYR